MKQLELLPMKCPEAGSAPRYYVTVAQSQNKEEASFWPWNTYTIEDNRQRQNKMQ